MKWINRHALILGLSFILLANMGLWAAVYWNRLGAPESTLVLSERELIPVHQDYALLHPVDKEGRVRQAIRFKLRVNNYSNRLGNMYRISQEKMEALGFSHEFIKKIGKPKPFFLWKSQKRSAFVVLEMDGPAYQQFIAKNKAVQAGTPCSEKDKECKKLYYLSPEVLKNMQTTSSRLYIVDVGLDKQALRTMYPDRSRYAIVPGAVVAFPLFRPQNMESPTPKFTGWVQDILVPEISLPLEWHNDSLYERSPRFEAEVSFGQRLEPWFKHLHLPSQEEPHPVTK